MAKKDYILSIIGLMLMTRFVFAEQSGNVDFTGSIMANSCVVTFAHKTIDLGSVSKASILPAGSVSNKSPFTIDLHDCYPGQIVQLRLTATGVGGEKDLIQTDGFATGVGVGIWESGQSERFAIDSTSSVKSADTSTLLSYDFEAAYVSLGNPTPGSAHATAVFEIVYP